MDLFAAQPLAFRRAPDAKVVGAYVLNEKPAAILDGLQPGSVSHLLYAFVRICGPGQLEKDAPACQGRQAFQLASGPLETEFDAAFQRLKTRQPGVKVLASVGGWGGSDPFFHLANEPARRAVFAASVVDFLRSHPGFDGVDIDWEHPGGNGAANGVQLGTPVDGQGYAELMLDLRRALDGLGAETGRRYLLSTAVNTTQTLV
ncbi:MAG: glycosyl hydrolase family 18 protein, partial [Burkholderiaceae bacterium]